MTQQEYKAMVSRVGSIGFLLVVAVLVISAIEQKQASFIKTMDIQIEPLGDSTLLIQEGDVLLSLDKSFGYRFDERPIKQLDVERIERVLEDDPFILDADVFIDATNVMQVSITQREPMLRIIDKNGLHYYLDKDGYKMPLSKHFTTRTMVASGNIPPHVPDFLERKRHILKDLFELAKFVEEDPFLWSMIEQMYVSNTGDIVFIPLLGDQKIIFGSKDRMEEKFRNLEVFYREVIPHTGFRKYETVDLSFAGQIVCK